MKQKLYHKLINTGIL